MRVTSSAFGNNQMIPSQYTCDGENISPPLRFEEVPDTAVSLVLIVDDPDAPAKTWVHWVVFDIDPEVPLVDEGSVPEDGVEGMTDFGTSGWGGPCPPSGTHRYFFKLYALDVKLELDESVTKHDVEDAMEGHVIEETELVGLYMKS